jgi:hypothetical protein
LGQPEQTLSGSAINGRFWPLFALIDDRIATLFAALRMVAFDAVDGSSPGT